MATHMSGKNLSILCVLEFPATILMRKSAISVLHDPAHTKPSASAAKFLGYFSSTGMLSSWFIDDCARRCLMISIA